MKKALTGLIILLCIFLVSCKKDSSTSSPTTPPTTLDFSAVDTLLVDSVPSAFNGNCYALIHINGQPAYSRGFGGYTDTTRKLIASCTKWLSGAVLMSFVDDGSLKLSDSIGKYLPIFTTYGKGNITIRQLFSHTSGFPGDSPQGYENNQFLTLAKAVDSIAKNVTLINTPGTKFYYGGVSMQIAGRICEVVSGQSWASLFAQRLTTPCGMTKTDFGIEINPGIAGGAFSTPGDYIKFLDMIMQHGVADNGTRVLSAAAVDTMEKSQTGTATIDYSPYPTYYFNPYLYTTHIYGIGNWRDLTSTTGDTLIENSSPGKFGSHPWIDRNKKVTGFIFTYIPINGYIATMPTDLTIRTAVRSIVP